MRLNLSEAVRHWAHYKADECALGGSNTLTYKQLNDLINARARCITQILKSGHEKIAILGNSNLSFVLDLLAIMRSGNIFVLINPTLSETQIVKSLAKINCIYYISETPINCSELNHISISTFENYLHSGEVVCDQIALTEDAGVIFSSGTTGEPKALMRNSFSILSEIIQWIIELQLIRTSKF